MIQGGSEEVLLDEDGAAFAIFLHYFRDECGFDWADFAAG